jgi:hypothetical protein
MRILKLFSVFLLLTLLTFSCQQEEVVTSLTESEGLQATATQGVDEISESIRLKDKTLVQSSPTYTGPQVGYTLTRVTALIIFIEPRVMTVLLGGQPILKYLVLKLPMDPVPFTLIIECLLFSEA